MVRVELGWTGSLILEATVDDQTRGAGGTHSTSDGGFGVAGRLGRRPRE